MSPGRRLSLDSLDAERWRRIAGVMDQVLELDEQDVPAHLERLCPDDPELRREVRALIEADAKARDFLSVPVGGLPGSFGGIATAGTPESRTPPPDSAEDTWPAPPTSEDLPPATSEDLPPTRVGRYEIRGQLGRGGMGIVYRGYDAALGRTVAIKTLPDVFAGDPMRVARLLREARLVALMHHPSIASLHGIERTDDDRRFVIFEYVEGRTLARRLRDGPLPLAEALDLAGQVADALNAAHARGIIHRDLKPANLMVTPSGLFKVLDFGLAKHVGQREPSPGPTESVFTSSAGMTGSGVQLGTLGYMSPEQILTSLHDARTDVFAFACVLYECLTGAPAFPGDSEFAVVSATLVSPVDWSRLPADTPPSLRALLERALEKDASRRLPDLQEFAATLAEVTRSRRHHDHAADAFPGTSWLAGSSSSLAATFVGRIAELRDCRHLLERSRLVTLMGAAGCGKTRLALEVARRLESDHPGGVWFVDLAPVIDAMAVVAAVAEATGVSAEKAPALAGELNRVTAGQPCLLVLDNCERMVAACSLLAAELLDGCPHLRILATSREWLGAAGEQTLRVPPLSMPDAEEGPEAIWRTESVRLFVERARAVRPQFELSQANAERVGELCRRLDGIPLAIEVAAARLGDQSLDAVVESLHGRLRTAGGHGDGREALDATLLWSYERLTDGERRLFRALSIFAGGWTLESATEICGQGQDEFAILDATTQLVDKSLVTIDLVDRFEPRYRLLEPLREFAAARCDPEEIPTLRSRHLAHFLEVAERAAPALLGGPEQAQAMARVAADHQNLLAALHSCALVETGAPQALRLAGSIWRFWYVRGYLSLGRDRLAMALALPGADQSTPERALALFAAGGLAVPQWDLVAADELNNAARQLYRALGDRLGEARALAHLGWAAAAQDRLDDARRCYEAAAEVFRDLGDERRLATMLNNLGSIARRTGDESALARYDEARELARRAGDRPALAEILVNMGLVMSRHGRLPAARRRLIEALDLIADLKARRTGVAGLEVAADLLFLSARPVEAARALGASEASRRAMNMPADQTWRRLVADLVERLRARLEPAALASAWSEGAAQSFEEAVTAAREALVPSETGSSGTDSAFYPVGTTHGACPPEAEPGSGNAGPAAVAHEPKGTRRHDGGLEP